jgi:protein-disulfide isomerase
MSKAFYAILLTAALTCAVAAQTRRGAVAQPKPAATAGAQAKPPTAKPSPRQTPAQSSPQQQGVAAHPPAPTAKADDCGCEAGPLPEVLASANGVKFTSADLSPQVQEQIAQLQQQVADARRRELDLQINSILLEAEAKKRGVSTTQLLDAEVVAKTVEPTAADAQSYFDQNRARITEQAGRAVDFADIKDRIIEFLRAERQDVRSKQFADTLRATADVKLLVKEATPPALPADRARVLATVNGKSITSGDVEDSLLPLVAQVQQQVYLLRKGDIDLKINDSLLNQEAQKRGVTSRALADAEVASKVPVVTEAQARDFYDKNKERINGDFTQTKYQIIEYLQQNEQQRLESAFAERLRNGASIQTFIMPPAPPAFQIAVDDQPTKGNQNASVTVVEFTDYQCPSCAATHPVLERLMTEYGDRVRLVVRDFPLQQHADARKAAEAAEAAREQGKYWDFVAILFRNQSALKPEMLKQYAQVLGLDRAKFDAALESGKFADKVERDILDGQKLGVNGTPTLFINGRRATDVSYEGLKASIESALKPASASSH